MPRGGGHKADGYSPYKHSNGRELKILKSSKSSNGYHRVVEQHKGKFYPKISIETGNGKKKQKVFGTASPTAREAAIKLAIYEDEPYELPVAPPRGPPSEYGEEGRGGQVAASREASSGGAEAAGHRVGGRRAAPAAAGEGS